MANKLILNLHHKIQIVHLKSVLAINRINNTKSESKIYINQIILKNINVNLK